MIEAWKVERASSPSAVRSERYRVRETPRGKVLECAEAPGLQVRVETGLSFHEAEARKLGERVILLDGAGRFPALLDSDQHLYNLDHHEGCVRAFTLATCEQALVVVMKGLELAKGDWEIYANQPDLDTVLALWILLNHRRVVALSAPARRILIPLVRLEGAIDANGRELAAFCGIPEPALGEAQRRLDRLLARLRELEGWEDLEPLERTAEMLHEIDVLVLSEAELRSVPRVEEVYGHAELGGDLVAVACRDPGGIYEVEERLRAIWGARLGMVMLEKRPGRYTLRSSAPPGYPGLGRLYDFLNLVDPAVNGRPRSERWGGADDIGGSPRERGSALSPEYVLRAVERAYRPRRSPRWGILRATWSSVGIAMVAAAGALLWISLATPPPPPAIDAAGLLAVSGACAGLASAWLAWRRSRRDLWVPGWRPPAGWDWVLMLPLGLLGGVLGGAWAPLHFDPSRGSALVAAAAAIGIGALGVEAWFRGWVQGLLLLEGPGQTGGGRWFLSRASVVTALLYAAVTVVASRILIAPPPLSLTGDWAPLLSTALGALTLGLALGSIRERSLSIVPAVAVHAAAGIASLLVRGWTGS